MKGATKLFSILKLVAIWIVFSNFIYASVSYLVSLKGKVSLLFVGGVIPYFSIPHGTYVSIWLPIYALLCVVAAILFLYFYTKRWFKRRKFLAIKNSHWLVRHLLRPFGYSVVLLWLAVIVSYLILGLAAPVCFNPGLLGGNSTFEACESLASLGFSPFNWIPVLGISILVSIVWFVFAGIITLVMRLRSH